MDETLSDDEIITNIYYLNKNTPIEIVKYYLKDDYENENDIINYLGEAISEKY